MVGQTISHYRITEFIGSGGMGEVYRALDTELGRDVAIKMLDRSRIADPVARERLLEEARTAAQLNHPGICTIHGVGEDGGRVFIAMELLPGRTLRELITPGGTAVESVLDIGIQLADSLAHAHSQNVIHRDLKAENVMLLPDGHAKILDFGLAKRLPGGGPIALAPAKLSSSGHIVGTPHYLAPELLSGARADSRSDLWSLGVLLYEMSTGAQPFEGESLVELSANILNAPMKPMSERVPAGLAAVVARCLAKRPEKRYASAGEVKAALEAVRSGAPVAVRGAKRYTQAALVIGTLVVVALTVWIMVKRRDGNDPQPIQATTADSGVDAALTASASLYASSGAREPRRIVPGSRVDLGDQLFLELQSPEGMHAYVLDGDERGEIYVLHPVPGIDPANPLEPAKLHRLPANQNWIVTSEGGRETILVIASRHPIEELERAIRRVPRAAIGEPAAYSQVAIDTLLSMRGIGAMTPPRSDAEAVRTLADLRQRLESLMGEKGNLWVWSIQLENRGG